MAAGAFALVAGACTGGDTAPTTTEASPPSTPTTAPTTTTLPVPVAQQVFEAVSPAIAFVETPLGTGSGILYAGSLLLTNAHVVWPFEEARVVFPDGTESASAPVIGWDMVADLAILSLEGLTGLPDPVAIADGAGLPTGSEMFLIGYPDETEQYPQPTLSQGLLSRVRSWEAAGLAFLQTDAAIAGGQSGGALVDREGRVVGISGLALDSFALALSAPQAVERAGDLAGGVDAAGLGDRRLPEPAGGLVAVEGRSEHFADEVTWVVAGTTGDDLTVAASGEADLVLSLVAPDGVVEATADEETGTEEVLEFTLAVDGPHVVALQSFLTGPSVTSVTSSLGLVPLPDPDHGRRLTVGGTVWGNGDYPGDLDWFTLDLDEGETVRVTVSSTNIDPDVTIDLADNVGEELAYDDDSGGGVLGTDAEVEFTAPETGTFLVVIGDVGAVGPGAYLIAVDGVR